MASCKPISIPLDQKGAGEILEDAAMYKKIVGSLIYIMITMPNLNYIVGFKSQFMCSSQATLGWCDVSILRYVMSIVDYGLFYEVCVTLQVYGYMDADWASCILVRRSTSGFMFSFESSAITWSNKKQPRVVTIALLSIEVEYNGNM